MDPQDITNSLIALSRMDLNHKEVLGAIDALADRGNELKYQFSDVCNKQWNKAVRRIQEAIEREEKKASSMEH